MDVQPEGCLPVKLFLLLDLGEDYGPAAIVRNVWVARSASGALRYSALRASSISLRIIPLSIRRLTFTYVQLRH
jgi:hypothetical protein